MYVMTSHIEMKEYSIAYFNHIAEFAEQCIATGPSKLRTVISTNSASLQDPAS